jgi:hypothetical protein
MSMMFGAMCLTRPDRARNAGQDGSMATRDEGHLPANMVSFLVAQPATETAVQEARLALWG